MTSFILLLIAHEIWLNLGKYHCKHLIIWCRVCKNFRLHNVTQEYGSTIRKRQTNFWLILPYVLVPENNWVNRIRKIKVIEVNLKKQLLINYKKFLLEALKTQSPFLIRSGEKINTYVFFIRIIRRFQIFAYLIK